MHKEVTVEISIDTTDLERRMWEYQRALWSWFHSGVTSKEELMQLSRDYWADHGLADAICRIVDERVELANGQSWQIRTGLREMI